MKENQNIFIMGDSYSTYQGYNPEGYLVYYSDERKDAPIVRGVEKTWWHRLAQETGVCIKLNDSCSGSTVCNTVRAVLPLSSSFVNRMDKYIAEDYFAKNNIDKLLIFGGTNDSWMDTEVGTLQYADWTEAELKCILPAFCYVLARAKTVMEDILVIINTELKEEITAGFIEACGKYGVRYLMLSEIDKESGHPTELGMEQIAAQVKACL